MNITKRTQLDLRKNTNKIIDIAKQWDRNSRTIEFEIIEDGNSLQIDSTLCRAEIAMVKPDNQQILNDCTISDNMISITFTEQMLASEGIAEGEIRIYDLENKSLCISSTFKMRINKSVVDDIKIQSTYEYNALTNIILSSSEYVKKCEDATANANNKIAEMNALQSSIESAENIRASNENQRIENENQRNVNEATRISDTNNAISECNVATENAIIATNLTNSAISAANTATNRANAAAEACENISNDFIDDETTVINKVWSSKKVYDELVAMSTNYVTEAEINSIFI